MTKELSQRPRPHTRAIQLKCTLFASRAFMTWALVASNDIFGFAFGALTPGSGTSCKTTHQSVLTSFELFGLPGKHRYRPAPSRTLGRAGYPTDSGISRSVPRIITVVDSFLRLHDGRPPISPREDLLTTPYRVLDAQGNYSTMRKRNVHSTVDRIGNVVPRGEFSPDLPYRDLGRRLATSGVRLSNAVIAVPERPAGL